MLKGMIVHGRSVGVLQAIKRSSMSSKDSKILFESSLSDVCGVEDVVYEIFKRVMNTGVVITGAPITVLLSIIRYLLVNPIQFP